MILRNDNDLIGDFIGTIPAMIALAERDGGLDVIVKDGVYGIFQMIPAKYNIREAEEGPHDIAFDLHKAFARASSNNWHMIQANFEQVALPVPESIPRPELEFAKYVTEDFDYILAPFSRSLPPEQKWQREKWQELVSRMSDKKFCLLGDKRYDDPEYITGPNVKKAFSVSMPWLCNLLVNSKHGLISVVTGISHLAYALNVPNYLFFNQGRWGQNPEARLFKINIPDISVQEVIDRL